MRVCHIGYNYFPGQGLTILYEYPRHEVRHGIEAHVIAAGRPEEPHAEIVDGVHVHRAVGDPWVRYSADRLRFTVQAGRLVREIRPDVVHVYAFPLFTGLLPWLGGRRPSKWIYNVQTSAVNRPLIRFRNRLTGWNARSFDAVIVLSRGIQDLVFGASYSGATVVPLGADLDYFRPMPPAPGVRERHGIGADEPVLIYTGNLDPDREIERLLAAFAQAAQQIPRLRLLIVGRGKALDDLQALARHLHIAERVTFAGFVPFDQVPGYLSVADVALAPVPIHSPYYHQPPTKTVEYLAAGLPTIASDTEGNRVFIRHHHNGLLAGDTPAELAAAIVELVSDPALQQRLRAVARESVTAFDWDYIVREQLIPFYQRVASAPPRAASATRIEHGL